MGKQTRKKAIKAETNELPRLALKHGQTIWLMAQLGLHNGASTSTFNYYVKSLRKLGIPIEKGKDQSQGHRHVTYNFEELMELAIVLLLRVYGVLPDPIVTGIRDFRHVLRPIYQQAYFDLSKQRYPSARLSARSRNTVVFSGLFLDLNIRYTAGKMTEFGPPRMLSPFEAATIFARMEIPARSYLPLNVTPIARMIIERSRVLPPMRRHSTQRV
jgi:hypothetical protein